MNATRCWLHVSGQAPALSIKFAQPGHCASFAGDKYINVAYISCQHLVACLLLAIAQACCQRDTAVWRRTLDRLYGSTSSSCLSSTPSYPASHISHHISHYICSGSSTHGPWYPVRHELQLSPSPLCTSMPGLSLQLQRLYVRAVVLGCPACHVEQEPPLQAVFQHYSRVHDLYTITSALDLSMLDVTPAQM